MRCLLALFGARGTVVLGAFAFVVSALFWTLGTATIPRAASWPWDWTPAVYIFHGTMFALVVASLGYVGTGLNYLATERVERQVGDG